MELQTLRVNTRLGTGKGPARQARMKGAIPAVVYGLDSDPVSMIIDRRTFEKAIAQSGHGEHAVMNLEFEDQPSLSCPVMIKDVQHHPVAGTITHADFMRIKLDARIQVLVPVALTGRCKGITDGGVPDQQLHELEIECLATAVPEQIELDITALEIGGSLHVSDVAVPAGITVVTEPDRSVIAIHPPRVAKGTEETAAGETSAS